MRASLLSKGEEIAIREATKKIVKDSGENEGAIISDEVAAPKTIIGGQGKARKLFLQVPSRLHLDHCM